MTVASKFDGAPPQLSADQTESESRLGELNVVKVWEETQTNVIDQNKVFG